MAAGTAATCRAGSPASTGPVGAGLLATGAAGAGAAEAAGAASGVPAQAARKEMAAPAKADAASRIDLISFSRRRWRPSSRACWRRPGLRRQPARLPRSRSCRSARCR
ncbi:MAG: hypothetical protein GC202_06135 [Alphaproteobacteria bacterium]|nr:hypothetical protein [Alphaproteobacteria bacterium]